MFLIIRVVVLWMLVSSVALVDAENEAFTELRYRAEQGDVQAQSELCAKYTVTGDAEPPDAVAAVKWCRNAADQGYAEDNSVWVS